jgi:hypothetical protein
MVHFQAAAVSFFILLDPERELPWKDSARTAVFKSNMSSLSVTFRVGPSTVRHRQIRRQRCDIPT